MRAILIVALIIATITCASAQGGVKPSDGGTNVSGNHDSPQNNDQQINGQQKNGQQNNDQQNNGQQTNGMQNNGQAGEPSNIVTFNSSSWQQVRGQQNNGQQNNGQQNNGQPDGNHRFSRQPPYGAPNWWPTSWWQYSSGQGCSVWTESDSYRVGDMVTIYYSIPSSTTASLTAYLTDGSVTGHADLNQSLDGIQSITVPVGYPTGERRIVLQTSSGYSDTCYFNVY